MCTQKKKVPVSSVLVLLRLDVPVVLPPRPRRRTNRTRIRGCWRPSLIIPRPSLPGTYISVIVPPVATTSRPVARFFYSSLLPLARSNEFAAVRDQTRHCRLLDTVQFVNDFKPANHLAKNYMLSV
ncbi:hypothetical protein AYI70_g2353 [Smittium culicis]|uniref:Uncharacterized protein n=1 Tax=Smittium culicis TaxID=133412 RepID=A0A1R1Y8T4_9FUNG|nr:hypothetical protein AYI70_g2353 [Smittium culicis]